MRRRPKKRSPQLIALQEQFRLEVVYGGVEEAGPKLCWFADYDGRPCSGLIMACHFVNRQRVNKALGALGYDPQLIELAEWDPRNAVCGCELHHHRFDSHAMPPLVIWREQVPAAVESFAAEWGVESSLAAKCPSISSECPITQQQETHQQGGSQ